ncbi:MAG: ribonuclease HIII [Methanoregula sp.]|jgi:ribonuclease HIII
MSPASLTISDKELQKLKGYILKTNLTRVPVTSEYELLRIKDGKVMIVVYKSGKVVHNGSEESEKILQEILKREENYDFIFGSDETGKGEWFGPLVVTATALTPEQIIELRKLGVRDSKTIKKAELMKLADKLFKMNFPRFTITLTPEKYNQMYTDFEKEGKSLNDMLAWAHSAVIKAMLKFVQAKKIKVVIDKFDFEKTEFRLEKVDRTNVEIIQKSKGESEIPVAAASIIAKYTFETEVDKLNEKYKIDLRKLSPDAVDRAVLSSVGKMHFKNVNSSK